MTTTPTDHTQTTEKGKMVYKEYYGINSLINAIHYAKNIRSAGYPARVSKTLYGNKIVGDK